MYRGLFLFVLEFFLFGINLYGWQSVGINHAHICDFKNKLCPLRVLEVSYRLQGRRGWGLLIKPDITFKLSKHVCASFSDVFQRICVIFSNAPSWKWINHLKMSTLRFRMDATSKLSPGWWRAGGRGGSKVESIFAPLRAPSTERGCSQATKHFGNRPFWKRWRGDNHVISVVQIYPD